MIYSLSILVAISATLVIRAKYLKSIKQLLIFKPIPLIIIIVFVAALPTSDLKYKLLILTGLLFSLIGDVFLINSVKHFYKGLISFLLGHICYIFAFMLTKGDQVTYLVLFSIIIISIFYLVNISQHTGKARIPVAVYIIIIGIMGWLAIERFIHLQNLGSLLSAIGAVSFMISDAVLAYNKYVKSFHKAELIILLTYFIAQYLIGLSVILH